MGAAGDILVTGAGVVSPIGLGCEAFWQSLCARRSGVKALPWFANSGLPVRFGGYIADFDPKQYVTPRKSLKVMSREIQIAFAAAQMAWADAGLKDASVDPDRLGVVFGADVIYGEEDELAAACRRCIVDNQFRYDLWGKEALSEIFPLWLLKYLPNMPACHVGIALDARGPNNTLAHGEVSSLLALSEAMNVIRRGAADVMIVGGTGMRCVSGVWLWQLDGQMSHRNEDPAAACRPFDTARDGFVYGEGAAVIILESRRHAEARRARPIARLLSVVSTCEPRRPGSTPEGTAIYRSIGRALEAAELQPGDVGHVNAHGISTIEHDRLEARAIRDLLGDVPVTAPKSFFGNLGAGSGAVELVASLLAFKHDEVPVTLNYTQPDPTCPVRVVHEHPLRGTRRTAVVLNQSSLGQAVAAVIDQPD